MVCREARNQASDRVGADLREEQRSHQSPRMPGFRMLCGSYAFLIRCDNGSATTLGDTCAQTSEGSVSKMISLDRPLSLPKSNDAPAVCMSLSCASPFLPTITRISPRRGSIYV